MTLLDPVRYAMFNQAEKIISAHPALVRSPAMGSLFLGLKARPQRKPLQGGRMALLWESGSQSWRGLCRCCAAKSAGCPSAAKRGFDVCDGSVLFVLSVGRIFLHPISGSAGGRLDCPPLTSQLI